MKQVLTLTALAAALALGAPASADDQEQPPAATKASLAVLPFTYNAEVLRRNNRGGLELWIEEFETSTFTNKFITALVQTRKFDVVERSRIDDLLDEIGLSDAGLTDSKRAVKAGKMIGADFVLTGEISVFSLETEWRKIPKTTRFSRKITALIIVDMRIVDSRTSRVVSANKGEVRHELRSMHQVREETVVSAEFIDDLQRELCTKLTIHTIDGVYPIRIIGLAGDDTVSLNRGEGGGLEVGQILDVFSEGQEMLDPDTGDSLGFEEVKIGRLQVTEILARFAKAEIVEAQNPLPKGAMCRKAETAEEAPADPPRRGPRW